MLSLRLSLSVFNIVLLIGVASRDVPDAGRGIAETIDRRRVSLTADILRGVGGAGRAGDGGWDKWHVALKGNER